MAGCSSPGVTQLIVVVDTDLVIPSEIDHLSIDVTGPSHMHAAEAHDLVSGVTPPFTLTVVPNGDALGPIDIVVAATLHSAPVVARTGRVTLVRGETRVVLLHLARRCVGTMCATGQTCSENGCVAIDDTPVYVWTGAPPRLGADAGVAIDGGHDAGPVDAGHFTDTNVDAAPLDYDAGPDCTTIGCDDMNPCTEDVCNGMRICEHRPLDIACDDGEFCNGLDHCGSGTCSLHAGNPCVGSTTCDETRSVCTGCTTDATCPPMMTGGFGPCGGYADACSNAGTQTQTVRVFHCMAGACVPSDSTAMQACFRDTTGTSCAATTCGAFGVCDPGSTGVCSLTGTASRTCQDFTCQSGTCAPAMRSESVACSRATDGMGCGAASCGGWGSCGGFSEPCGTSGTQTRSCNSPVCSGGTCTPGGTTTESQGCSRGTDGVSCGASTCDGWGACGGFADACATNGTQSRTCHDPVCSGGGCADHTRTETQGCTRGTDGASCGGPECGAAACTGGLNEYQCDQDGFLESSCRDRICGGGTCGYGGYYTMTGGPCTVSTDYQGCYAGSGCDYCYGGNCQYGGC